MKKTIQQLIDAFNADKQANHKSLIEYKEALQYYHGEQLEHEALAILQERGQKPIIENIYKMIVNKILGYKIQAMQEIRVYGRIEKTKNKAHLLQEIIRSFNQSKIYERDIYLRDRDLLFGMGVLELWVIKDKDGNNQITLKHIPTESFLVDKFSTDLNALDATRFHKILNIGEVNNLEFDTKPHFQNINNDKRATIIESWFKNGNVWDRYIWHTDGFIYKYEQKPFLNGIHPFVVSKFQQDHDFTWYGIFRDLKPVQDYINIAENRIANMLGGSVKAFVEESAILDIEDFSFKIARDNVVIRVRDGALKDNKIRFIEHQAQINNLSQKVQEKRNIAKILSGLNEEALGMATNRQSGVAIAQRRDMGLMGLQNYVMQTDIADRILYEKFIDLVQYYYTKPQLFRITDSKNIERYFEINTNKDNTIEVGEYDLIYTTQLKQTGREERFAHWTELLKTISQIRPDLITTLLPYMLKDSDSPIISDIEEVLQKADQAISEEEQQAQAQEAQMQKDLQIAQIKAQIQETESKALKYQAQADLIAKQQNIEKADKKAKRQLQLSTTDMR